MVDKYISSFTYQQSEEATEAITEEDLEESEISEIIQVFQVIEPDIETFYQQRGRFPLNFQEIEQQIDVQYTDYVLDNFNIKENGIIVGQFSESPEVKVYGRPLVDNSNNEFSWECYQINIRDTNFPECEYSDIDIFE